MRSLFFGNFGNRAAKNATAKADRQKSCERRGRNKPALNCAVEVAGLSEPVWVRQNPRARRMTLRVSGTQRAAVLTIPPEANLRDANRFLQKHADWIARKLAELPQAVTFTDGAVIPVRGISHEIVFKGEVRKRTPVWIEPPLTEGEFARLCVKGSGKTASKRVYEWLKMEARKDVAQACAYHAERLGVRYRKLAIRDQSTRWGSCSSSGTLSFSWRLIMAPSYVLDYVAAHEVAHLREMNHSPAFWALVKATLPDMERGRDWLKHHGIELHRYTPLS